MSSDPAINAAEKVWATDFAAYSNGRPFNPDDALADAMIAAARETLEPLRERHKPVWDDDGQLWRCEYSGHEWPCDDSRDIYPEDEL